MADFPQIFHGDGTKKPSLFDSEHSEYVLLKCRISDMKARLLSHGSLPTLNDLSSFRFSRSLRNIIHLINVDLILDQYFQIRGANMSFMMQ
jgi:hypothetical protein